MALDRINLRLADGTGPGTCPSESQKGLKMMHRCVFTTTRLAAAVGRDIAANYITGRTQRPRPAQPAWIYRRSHRPTRPRLKTDWITYLANDALSTSSALLSSP